MRSHSPRSGPLLGLPHTLLIVDDDASLRSALESVLTPMGYRVLTAADADAAYARLASESPDGILLDIRLPGISGLALYLVIIHRWPYLEGRIAFITGDADAPEVRVWLERGHHTTFRKPFSLPQIAAWLALVSRAAERPATDRRA